MEGTQSEAKRDFPVYPRLSGKSLKKVIDDLLVAQAIYFS